MKQVLSTFLMAAGLVSAAAAAPSVAGTWTLSVQGSPHGDMTLGLILKQDGTKITGTFNSPHGDMDVAGEFVKGELKIATTAGSDDDRIVFSAQLKEDGTLAGYVSSPMGDMKWTASRVDEKSRK
jgi:hypothetical protein